jgi:hypothetical protein
VPGSQRPDYHCVHRPKIWFITEFRGTPLALFLEPLVLPRDSERVPLLRPRLVDPLVKETDELARSFVRSIRIAEQRKR